ncbi:MAG: metal-sulfur cluster assembly factor [Lysobacteraceae bacterium]
MKTLATDPAVARIEHALRLVIDPELGCNIVDLGLVYDVSIDLVRIVHIVMTTTTRGCPATGYLQEAAKNATEGLGEFTAVEVELTYDPPWTPQKMSAEAKRQFAVDDGGGR